MYKYEIKIFWNEDENCYYAIVPGIKEFRYVSASGETPEEALEEIQTAIELVIECMKEDGKAIPEPVVYSTKIK